MKFMRVAVGSDHAGFDIKEKIKEFLESREIEYKDFGTFSKDSCDYPDYVQKTAEPVASGDFDRGIFVCKTGSGTSMAANKIKGIRACQAFSVEAAKLSREHNDANFLALGDMQGYETVLKIIDAWLNTHFSNEERHARRIEKIKKLEG